VGNLHELRAATIDGDVRAAWLYLLALVRAHGDVELTVSPLDDHCLIHARRVFGGRETVTRDLGTAVLRLFPAEPLPVNHDPCIPF